MTGFWKEIRRRALQRQAVVESVMTSNGSRPQSKRLAREIARGEVSPEDFSVEHGQQQRIDPKDRGKKPWHDLESFLTYVNERRHRIGFGLSRKKHSLPTHEDNQVHSIVPSEVAEELNVNSSEETKRNAAKSAMGVVKQDTPSFLPGSLPGPSTGLASTGVAGFGNTRSLSGEAWLTKRNEHTLGPGHESNIIMSDASTGVATGSDNCHEEPVQESATATDLGFGQNELNIDPDIISTSVSPRNAQDREWISSAMTIKDGTGVEHSEKAFFDTGSEDNLSTDKFASDLNLETRPILPEDLMVYYTPNGDFIPKSYFEVYLKCPKRGIPDFVKVRFVVVQSLKGMGLVLGSTFMSLYGVKLDPTQGRDMYPVTAREAGKAAKEAQKRYLAEVVKATERANNIAASTAGPTTATSGASQGDKHNGSSRTSTSSTGNGRPK